MNFDLHNKREQLVAHINDLSERAESLRVQWEEARQAVAHYRNHLQAMDMVLSLFPAKDDTAEQPEQPGAGEHLPFEQTLGLDQPAKTLSIPDMVMEVLRMNPDKYYTAVRIAELIVGWGYQPTSDTFAISVSTACARLEKRGKISMIQQDGVRAFALASK